MENLHLQESALQSIMTHSEASQNYIDSVIAAPNVLQYSIDESEANGTSLSDYTTWPALLDAVLEQGTVCTDALGDDRAMAAGAFIQDSLLHRDLNYDATYEARGSIILDLYKDYNLHSLIDKYPETRLRFFLMTVFKDSNIELINKLNQLMIKMKSGEIDEEGLETYLHKIHDEIELTKAEKYFLTRLVFDHVDSADYAELISRDYGDKGLLDLSVKIQDSSNELFTILSLIHI